ncbi:hypothetical protein [Streptomyces noursei]|uniref:hypothetical protein n=1 Tax=Streptomyces noursei TaxID=1971 RepID=UPI0019BD9474|nr:hypothetical protein [Streptomyces noursei]MCZ1019596.1 hypothetical protein [Streptomyces noursei]GGX09811.1 hypothetical protein GCM10010341_34390 [Streptomyces noursei]
MVRSKVLQAGDLNALVAALASEQRMVVVAPNGTVNTGLVTGDQRQVVATSTSGGSATGPMRQGPVRAKDLKSARRRFVPPPGFENALTALDSGISVLVGEPGTGRETHGVNLLAHGREEPVLVQVDGAVDLSRWEPWPQGVHGYLVMEPPDPFALRAWDLSRLEAPLAKAGARLLIVLADASGLATTLEDHLGTPVLRHLPPDPRKVFTAHLAEFCPDKDMRAQLLRSLGPRLFDELLRAELPPRYAAQAAGAVARLGASAAPSCATVLHALAHAESMELVARAQEDPELLAHLVSLSVYDGLDRGVVVEQAAELLALANAGREQWPGAQRLRNQGGRQQVGAARQRTLPEILRAIGAHRGQQPGRDATDPVSFFWPTVGDAVWEVLCRDHTDLLPLFHTWLAGTGSEPVHVARAGKAIAAMAVATGGRTLRFLRHLALVPWPSAAEMAAWCLGATARDPATAAKAEDLLEQWSVAPEAALRKAVAYACRSDHGHFTSGQALRLLHQLVETLTDDAGDVSVVAVVAEVLMERFMVGDSRARGAVLARMWGWAGSGGVPSVLAARAFPAMAGTDLSWCGSQIVADAETAACMVHLTGHALNEATTYAFMREVLLTWCCGADDAAQPDPGLEELLKGLTQAREPGFLRWLLAVERGPDSMPGKVLAERLLTVWRSKPLASNTD